MPARLARYNSVQSDLEAVDAPILLEHLELSGPHEAEGRGRRHVRVAVRGGPRIGVLLTLEVRRTGALARLDDERTWVAFVLEMSNSRRIRCGATGRGESAGKASAWLVYTLWYPLSSEQSAGGVSWLNPLSVPPSLLHAHTSN